MHWWYLLIVLFILLVTIRLYVVPNNKFVDGKMIRSIVSLALMVAIAASCTGGLLARLYP